MNKDKNSFDIAFANHSIGFANWLFKVNCEKYAEDVYLIDNVIGFKSLEELYKLYLETL